MAALDPERFAALRRDFPGTDLDELLAIFLTATAVTVDALAACAAVKSVSPATSTGWATTSCSSSPLRR